MSRLVIVGDVLLDRDVFGVASRLTPDAPAPVLDEREVHPRPGGAGLAALLAARDGHAVTLVTAIADDAGGAELRELLSLTGVQVVDLKSSAATCEKIRLLAEGRSLARWDRGGRTTADEIGPWTADADTALADADAVLVSCYGRGVTARDDVRDAIRTIVDTTAVVWDPHPRGATPVAGCTVVTPNHSEACEAVGDVPGDGLDAVRLRAERLIERWNVRGCAITLGADGALFTTGSGMPLVTPAPRVTAHDACGAGDRFASTLAGRMADGASAADAVPAAVHDSARFVAAGGATAIRVGEPGHAALAADAGDPFLLAEQVRARGGTVVATGGCFDLVHTGHVHVLEAARALGDCLIVCLNSDDSVRRLKGPQRPIVGQDDRAELLRALSSVDGVVVFDEDTPVEVLRRLKPHVFAKGGDYGDRRIPEADALAEWGGQAVTLPYLEDRSTTRLLEEVRNHGQP